ncbi:DUF1311 domain-containing protein [bacterium CPR1]|nr:DUF1311 domain-containing protein [bacterium CPR1]
MLKRMLLIVMLTATVLAQSQHEMNAQAAADFAKADKDLNAVYKQLTARLQPLTKEKLITAQLLWIKLRDADAEARASEWEGGSMYPMIYESTRARVTRQRVAELREWLDELKER